jgi:hypothetical protein
MKHIARKVGRFQIQNESNQGISHTMSGLGSIAVMHGVRHLWIRPIKRQALLVLL